jgi:hypothetical protein
MAPVSGSTSFTVEHPGSERYYVVAPWGRIFATFSTVEDGPLAEAFAGALAEVETEALELAAGHMEVRVAEIVMAFQAAYDEVAPGALNPVGSGRAAPAIPETATPAHRRHDRRRCRTRASFASGTASNRAERRGGTL